MDKKKKGLEVAIILIIFLSVVLNVILLNKNYSNMYIEGKESYNSILNIRAINEANNKLITKAIDSRNIENLDLLKLYENYGNMNDNISNLWYEYSNYRENRTVFQRIKKINTNSVMINEINERLEDYLKGILETEMTNQNYTVIVSDKLLDNLNMMLKISDEIKDYYNNFLDDKLRNVNEEDRLKIIVRKHYWIDILEKLNEVDNRYIDYEFSL